MQSNEHDVGVGATEELRLRVSVATLCRVLFAHPDDGQTMLALERSATLRDIEGRPTVTVKAKPFGGAVRLRDPQALKRMIGNFHYDSERSRREQDFRLQIQPETWEQVKVICRQHVQDTENAVLDASPERELAEEFEDTLHIRINPDQYRSRRRGMLVDDRLHATDNVRAPGRPTARFYYLFDVWIVAPALIAMMLDSSSRYGDADLQHMAWNDARQGGRGRANAMLVLRLEDLQHMNRSTSPDRRGVPIRVGSYQLDGNVLAILEEDDTRLS